MRRAWVLITAVIRVFPLRLPISSRKHISSSLVNVSGILNQDILSHIDVDGYFRRINYTGDRDVSLKTLRNIQLHHTLSITFETVDVNLPLEMKIQTDLYSIQNKIICIGRGGYCFEQNVLLYYILKKLGYEVYRHPSRVHYDEQPNEERGDTHIILRVVIDNISWMVDVAFGRFTPTAPLKLILEGNEKGEVFVTPYDPPRRLVRMKNERIMHEVKLSEGWTGVNSFSFEIWRDIEVEIANWYMCSHPNSYFIKNLVFTRITKQGRYAFFNNKLSYYSHDNSIAESSIVTTPEKLLDIAKTVFNVDLPKGTVIGPKDSPFPTPYVEE
mmetsp:Transcript_22310/g.22482  ORF Transcript_22310/g.22482 Transcript_22310/m.22482 type:complete len:328 (+) Transcript_22310:118-1101(+)